MPASPTIHLTAAPLPSHVDLFYCDGCEEVLSGIPSYEVTHRAGYKYPQQWTERLCGECKFHKFGSAA